MLTIDELKTAISNLEQQIAACDSEDVHTINTLVDAWERLQDELLAITDWAGYPALSS